MKIKQLLKLCFGLTLLSMLLMMTDFNAIKNTTKQLNSGFAILGMLVFLIGGILDMWRFRLASFKAQQKSWGAFTRICLESYVMGQLLPGQMGIDAYRITMMGKDQKHYAEPLAVLLGLRCFSLLIISCATAILVLLLPEWQAIYLPYLQRILFHSFGAYLAFLFAIIVLFFFAFRLFRHLWKTLKNQLGRIKNPFHILTSNVIYWLAILSLLILTTRVLTFIFTLQAFDIEMKFLVASSIALLAALSWLLPISPAGIGVREGVIVGLLSWFGVSFESALMVALLNRAYFIILAICGGVLFLLPKTSDTPKQEITHSATNKLYKKK